MRDVEVAGGRARHPTSRTTTSPIAVPSGTPVVLNQLAVQEGVRTRRRAAEVMFARNWKSYDEGVDNAVA